MGLSEDTLQLRQHREGGEVQSLESVTKIGTSPPPQWHVTSHTGLGNWIRNPHPRPWDDSISDVGRLRSATRRKLNWGQRLKTAPRDQCKR